MPSQLNDLTVHFLARPCISDVWSPNQTRRLIRVPYIPLHPPKVYTSSVAKEAELTMVCPAPPPSMAPSPHIVDCLHIWPLPRGGIHFGWHRCILTDWSFWFGSQGNSLDFSFIVNFLKLKVGLIKNLSMEKIKYLWLQSSRICGLARSEFMIMGWGGHLMPR